MPPTSVLTFFFPRLFLLTTASWRGTGIYDEFHFYPGLIPLVCVALGWGGLHHTVARPRVERGDGRVLGILPRSLLGEASVGMAVLLAAAILVDSKPPPQPAPRPPEAVTVSP